MRPRIRALFIAAELLIYGLFLRLDMLHQPSVGWKYASICLCVAAVLVLTKGQWLMRMALFLTLLADTFLLLLDRQYLIGVLCFCAVQLLYAVRLSKRSGKYAAAVRLMSYGAALLVLYALRLLEPLTAAAALSFTQLTVNAVMAQRKQDKRKSDWMTAWGLTLFLACDICVGLYNIKAYVPIWVCSEAVSIGMWLFYLPAQVLLVLSAYEEEKEEKTDEE